MLLKTRHCLKDHVVLVYLGIERVDLTLTKGVVQGVVDGLGRDAKARSGRAVDDEPLRQATERLVGHHVGKFGQLLETTGNKRTLES